jgi:hypothetical protein
LSQPSGCVFHHPNNICWGVQIIKLLIMQSSPLPCYKSINHSHNSINHSFIQSVSISVNQDQSYIWIICPLMRWAWVHVLCTVGRRGYRNLMLGVSLCSVARTDADKDKYFWHFSLLSVFYEVMFSRLWYVVW